MGKGRSSGSLMWTVLWIVTFARIVLIPPFLLLASQAQALARAGDDFTTYRTGSLVVLLLMGASDLADGWIARRYDLTTQIGAVIDAVADKSVQIVVATFFAVSRGPAFAALPLWFLGLLVARDLAIGGGWLGLRIRGVRVRVVHRPHGRLAALGVFAVLASIALGVPTRRLSTLVAAAAVLVVASTVAYLSDGVAQVMLRSPRAGA